MIGDKVSDVIAGQRAGVTGLFLGDSTADDLPRKTPCFSTFGAAIDAVL